MKQVFVYLRVSTKQQVDGDGYDRQLEKCQTFCQARQWTILRTFEEQETGAAGYKDRKQMLDMLEKCEDLGIKTVVVERVDRVARDVLVQELFFKDCKEKGIEVYAADTGEEWVLADADASRKLMRQIFGALAQWEKETTVMKLQHGRRKKAEETGKPCGGPRRYGDHEDPEIRAREKTVIKEILFLKIMEQLGDLDVCRLLTGRFPTPSGNHNWARSTLWRLFSENDYGEYAGNLRKEVELQKEQGIRKKYLETKRREYKKKIRHAPTDNSAP